MYKSSVRKANKRVLQFDILLFFLTQLSLLLMKFLETLPLPLVSPHYPNEQHLSFHMASSVWHKGPTFLGASQFSSESHMHPIDYGNFSVEISSDIIIFFSLLSFKTHINNYFCAHILKE